MKGWWSSIYFWKIFRVAHLCFHGPFFLICYVGVVSFQAVRTLAKSPTFARDPRHLQFEADVNRLFLYTRSLEIEKYDVMSRLRCYFFFSYTRHYPSAETMHSSFCLGLWRLLNRLQIPLSVWGFFSSDFIYSHYVVNCGRSFSALFATHSVCPQVGEGFLVLRWLNGVRWYHIFLKMFFNIEIFCQWCSSLQYCNRFSHYPSSVVITTPDFNWKNFGHAIIPMPEMGFEGTKKELGIEFLGPFHFMGSEYIVNTDVNCRHCWKLMALNPKMIFDV